MTIIYHKDIGFPTSHPRPQIGLLLTYGRHAIFQAAEKLILNLPPSLPTYELIEIYFDGHKLNKYVVRVRHNHAYDLVLVINPDGFVRTCWLNDCTDTHRTLNRSRYTQPNTTGGHHNGKF